MIAAASSRCVRAADPTDGFTARQSFVVRISSRLEPDLNWPTS